MEGAGAGQRHHRTDRDLRHAVLNDVRAIALLIAAVAAVPAMAGTVVSPAASHVAVTIYRDPGRGEGAMNRNWPGGYALISETRTLHIPAGASVIRFEGVAEGMLPESAVVSGLPREVREKNRDARLISPAGLVDAYLKRQVMIRRTSRATGKTIAQDAIIQAGPSGGVILKTGERIEALGCSGLPERMIYAEVPDDLSARPTLSVLTDSERELTVTVQLTYLAEGFDWSADYVAEMADDRETMGLFAWLTIANGGRQGFDDADLQVVAGRPNREAKAAQPSTPAPELHLQCWPMDITSTHNRIGGAPPPPPPPPPPMMAPGAGEDIVVTARRRGESLMSVPMALSAIQEELGDLKLYRVPARVTVAAHGQKQVAMLNQPESRFERIYSANVDSGDEDARPMTQMLRSTNVKAKGLGLPLPAGHLTLFEPVDGQTLLAGEADLGDHAIGEKVEFAVGDSPDVTWTLRRMSASARRASWRAQISNARDVPVQAELVVPYELASKPKGIERGQGGWILKTVVPANGTASIDYAVKVNVVTE
jgi:hypothetical protein